IQRRSCSWYSSRNHPAMSSGSVHSSPVDSSRKRWTLRALKVRRMLVSRQCATQRGVPRSEEHTSELQSLMRTSYAVFCLKKKKQECTSLIQQIIDTKYE